LKLTDRTGEAVDATSNTTSEALPAAIIAVKTLPQLAEGCCS